MNHNCVNEKNRNISMRMSTFDIGLTHNSLYFILGFFFRNPGSLFSYFDCVNRFDWTGKLTQIIMQKWRKKMSEILNKTYCHIRIIMCSLAIEFYQMNYNGKSISISDIMWYLHYHLNCKLISLVYDKCIEFHVEKAGEKTPK